MPVSGVGSANSYIYENVNKSNNRNKVTSLFNRAGIAATSNSRGVSEQSSSFSANDAYSSMAMKGMVRSEIGELYIQSLNCRNTNFLIQAKGEVQKVDNERYSIDVSDEIAGYWRIYDKEMGQSFTFDPMSTSIQTDENTGKDYIVSCDPWGGLIDVMYADNSLIEGIKTFLQTDQVSHIVLIQVRHIFSENRRTVLISLWYFRHHIKHCGRLFHYRVLYKYKIGCHLAAAL